jgi:hypothetical protein
LPFFELHPAAAASAAAAEVFKNRRREKGSFIRRLLLNSDL